MARKVDSTFNNFARGKIDHDMGGRWDLPVYTSGSDVVLNWITNFKGNAIFRSGFEVIEKYQNAIFIEFKFNLQQQYLCVFTDHLLQFLAYDNSGNVGWVLNGGGTTLQVVTPWLLSDLSDASFTQNFDQMIITQWNYEPQTLKRTGANSFTVAPYSRKLDPYPLTWAATKAITGITKDATGAVFTIVGHGYTAGQRFLVAGVVGMVEMNTWTACVSSVVDANHVKVADINSANFTAYSSGGTAALVLTGDYPHACLFYKGRLWYAATQLHGTRLLGSFSGNYFDHTLTQSGGTIGDSNAIQVDIVEIAQRIEWLFPGDNSLIAGATDGILAINGGAINVPITANNIDAQLTSAQPCNGTYPFKKDALVFYIGKAGRNMYYFNYDILQEVFVSHDANELSYDITLGGVSKMRWKKDRNDLIFMAKASTSNGNIVACNFLRDEKINGWTEFSTNGQFKDIAVITDNTGTPRMFALHLRSDGNYYIEREAQYVEFKKPSDFFTDKTSEKSDLNAYIRYTSEQLKQCCFLDNSIMLDDLQIGNLITFNGTNAIAAATNVFSAGDVGKHIVYQTNTGYESGRFKITAYTDPKHVSVAVLQAPTSNTYSNWYRTFQTVSGLADYNTLNVSVVADGGYLKDAVVSGGTIDLGNQYTSIWVGFKYRGVLKSFILGFEFQGVNTQEQSKIINTFYVRCVYSAGLAVGASQYRTEAVQKRQDGDINYLPPQLMDGTKQVPYTDSSDRDKSFYVIQDQPLPATVVGVIVTAAYTMAP